MSSQKFHLSGNLHNPLSQSLVNLSSSEKKNSLSLREGKTKEQFGKHP